MDAHRSQEETVPRTCAKCGTTLKPGQPDARCPRCALAFLVRRQPGAGDRDDSIDTAGLGLPEFKDYRCIELVAEGGMGQVFRAQQRSARREVAVKVLHRSFLNSPRAVQRFTSEIDAIARLEHRHILPLYEAGEENGLRFFSMRLARGGSLADAIKALRWKPARDASEPERQRKVASFLANVAQAVQHAHARGVIHRDLKPGNILLDETGEPLVADFGLAKASDSDIALTRTGEAFGTPAYMAPEQVDDSQHATTASDVYALGVILYELLAGTVPFHAASLPALLEAIRVQDPSPISSSNPRINRDLETICLKCLNKEPARRYTSAGELEAELHRWLRGEPILARPADTVELARRWVRRHRTLASVLGVFVLTAAAGFVGVLQQWRETTRINSRLTVEISASQRNLAERSFDDGDVPKAVMRLSSQLRRYPDDRASAARLADALVRRAWPVPVGILTYPTGKVSDFVWSRDGRWVAAAAIVIPKGQTGQYHFSILEAQTGRSMGSPQPVKDGFGKVEFSPDGKQVLTSFGNEYRLWSTAPLVPVDCPGIGGREGSDFAWSPDNRSVLICSGTNRAIRIGIPGCQPDKSDAPDSYPMPGTVSALALSRDGTLVGIGDELGNTRFWTTNSPTPLTSPPPAGAPCIGIFFNPAADRAITITTTAGCTLWAPREGRMITSFTNAQYAVFLPAADRVAVQTPSETLIVDSSSGAVLNRAAGVQFEIVGQSTPDGRILANSKSSDMVAFLNPATLSPISEPLRSIWSFNSTHFSPAAPILGGTVEEGTVELWRLTEPPAPSRTAIENADQYLMMPSAGLVAAAVGNRIQLRSTAEWDRVVLTLSLDSPVLELCAADSARLLAAIGKTGDIHTWSTRDGAEQFRTTTGSNDIAHLAISKNGRFIATVSAGSVLRQWDLTLGKEIAAPLTLEPTTERHMGRGKPHGLWFSPDGSKLCVACYWGEAPVFKTGTTNRLYLIDDDLASIRLQFSHDGRWIAAGGGFGQSRVFDAETGTSVTERLVAEKAALSVEFSDDDALVAIGTIGGGARVWQRSTGELLATTPALGSGDPCRIRFASDGRRFATVANGVVRVWENATGLPLSEPIRLSPAHRHIDWSPDNSELRVWGAQTTLATVPLTPADTPVPPWLPALAESLVGRIRESRTAAGAIQTVSRQASTEQPQNFWHRWAKQILQSPWSTVAPPQSAN